MQDRLRPLFRHWLFATAAGFALLAIIVYGRALSYGFIELDDATLIFANPTVQRLTWGTFKTIFTTYDPELYIPLTLFSFQLDTAIAGLNPFVFHLHNLIHHVANAILFAWLAQRLLGNRWIGILSGAVFLAHPTQVEAVLWASARKDVLAATFFLASLHAYLTFARKGGRNAYAGSLAAFIVGLLCKVSIIPLPLILFLVDWIDGRRIDRRAMLNTIPFFTVAVIFGIVALIGKSHFESIPLLTMLLIGAKSAIYSLQLLFVPYPLSPLYPYTQPIALSSPAFFLPIIAVSGMLFAAWLLRRRWPMATFCVLFYLLTLAPTFFNLIKGNDYFLASDRYVYIPAMGVVLLLGSIAAWSWNRIGSRVVIAMGIALVAVLSILSVAQTRHWKNDLAMTEHILHHWPESRIALLWRGHALLNAGRTDEGEREYAKLRAFSPTTQLLYNEAVELEAAGKYEEAIKKYEGAIALRTSNALAQVNVGRLYYQAGRKAEAETAFNAAARYAPMIGMPFFNLGVLAAEKGDLDGAIRMYRKALDRDPSLVDARVNLAAAYAETGRSGDAIRELEHVLDEDPEHPVALQIRRQMEARGMLR